ncbi:MAG: ATP-binding protein [Paludibacter sp.]|nr:ATP-binding protein [Paludibacter sp.]
MSMIIRDIEKLLTKRMFSGKAIVVIGARQTGKTTSLLNLLQSYSDVLLLDGDDRVVRETLNEPSTEQIKSIVGKHKIVFIDEVQRIPTIGLTAKIIVDKFKDIQLLLSGSSALDIKNQLSESLTGRKWEYLMFPVSWSELEQTEGYIKSLQQLELRLIYGMYPEIITHPSEEKERLKQLIDSYLYKDLLAFSNIQKPEVLEKLLQALAFQTGSEVSYNELAQLLHVDKNTIKTYIEILEKGFVVFTLNGFSRNLRNELKLAKKIYFWDCGIRNAIINNFNPLSIRDDKGVIWENFIISERMKKNNYANPFIKSYFWRTTSQQEIDYIEEVDGKISAYEIKWNESARVKRINAFTDTYKAKIATINRLNFRDLLC